MGKHRRKHRSRSRERISRRNLAARLHTIEKQLAGRGTREQSSATRSRSPTLSHTSSSSATLGNLGGPSRLRSRSRHRSQIHSSGIDSVRPCLRADRALCEPTLRTPTASSRGSYQNFENRHPSDEGSLDMPTSSRSRNLHDDHGAPNLRDNTPPLILNNDVVLEDTVLQLLGADPNTAKNLPYTVHQAIATRWNHILTAGLPDQEVTALKERTRVPDNLSFLTPPVINPEIVPYSA